MFNLSRRCEDFRVQHIVREANSLSHKLCHNIGVDGLGFGERLSSLASPLFLCGPAQGKFLDSKSNLQLLEIKVVDDIAEEFLQQFEAKYTILSRRIRVADLICRLYGEGTW